MNSKIFLFLGVFITCFPTFSQKKFKYNHDFETILSATKNEKSPLFYSKLFPRFTSNENLTDNEMLALLIGFTARPEYQPYENLVGVREMYNLNLSKEFGKTIALGEKFLSNHPFSVKAHIEKAFAHQNKNELEKASYHSDLAKKILSAMEKTGSGLSDQSPIFALGPNDAADYVQANLKANMGTKGNTSNKEGNTLEVLQAKFESGKNTYYYFNIEHASKSMFGGLSSKKGKKRKN